MFSVNSNTTVGQDGVVTSDKGGMSNEQISELATNKIVSISENAPEPIKQQAHIFADNVRNLLQHYIELARKEPEKKVKIT